MNFDSALFHFWSVDWSIYLLSLMRTVLKNHCFVDLVGLSSKQLLRIHSRECALKKKIILLVHVGLANDLQGKKKKQIKRQHS